MSDRAQEHQGLQGRLRAWISRPPPDPSRPQLRSTPHHRARWIGIAFAVIATLCLLPVIGTAYVINRIADGPIELSWLSQPFASAMSKRLGAEYHVDIGPMTLEDSDHGPRLAIAGFTLKTEDGRTIVAAPMAEASINPLPLLYGQISPRRLEIMDVEVRLSVLEDGAVAVSAGTAPIILTGASSTAPAAEASDAPSVSERDVMKRLGEALRNTLDSATRANSPIGALKRLGISHGRLVFDDQVTRQTTVFEGFELDFDRSEGRAALAVSAQGPNGRWRAEAYANGSADQKGGFDISLTNLTLDEILLVAGVRDPGFDFNMPLSAQLNVAFGEDGRISQAGGRVTAGAGFFFLDDKDHEPVQVDKIEGGFAWNATSRRFDLDQTVFVAGETRFTVAGTVTPPAAGDQTWKIDGRTLERAVFGPERPKQTPVFVDRAVLAARYVQGERKLLIDKLELAGPELSFSTTAEIDITDAGPHVRMNAKAGQMPAMAALRLWPSAVAAQVRSWFLRNLRGGVLEQGTLALDLDPEGVAALRRDRAPPDESLRLTFALSNTSLVAMAGLPPLSSLDGSGVVTGRTSNFVATRGALDVNPGQRLTLVEGSLSVPDADVHPTPAAINMRITGPLDAVADLFDREALKPYAQLPIDATTVKGQIDGRLALDIKLGDNVKPEDTRLRASASLTNFSVEKLVGQEKLEAAALTVTAERGLLNASGQGRLFGAPATIELRKKLNAPTEAVIGMTLDDAARTKLGMNFGASLTGPIGAKMSAVLGQKEKARAQVEIDFTRAAIDNLLPGYTKTAGRAAKASFTLVNDPDGPDLENFIFDGGTAYARGTIELDPNGGLERVRLSPVRLSPGDDMSIVAEPAKDVLKLSISGKAVDARPFLKLLTTGAVGTRTSKDFDVELKAANITGHNKQTASNVEMKMGRRGGVIRQFQLTGRFGKDAVSGSMVRSPAGQPPQIGVSTNDAGSLLSFFDFYKRMEGGKLQLVATIEDSEIEGTLGIRDFVVRNEPALQKLVTEGVASRDRSGQIRIDTNAAAFARMQVGFTRGQGRIDLRDGVINGPAAGTTIEGYIDTLNDRVNMTGTFVPAYGLNNMFAKIPVLGIFLGGGTNEGLFGVNFRISGPATAPVLTINPLSALAPGFLRKIFGAGEVGTSQMPQAPPAPASAPPTGGKPMQYAPTPGLGKLR
ncbi:MAG: hypothetical protein JWO64_2916 [Hyphomicrobiales bacterium]|nr:hypothetical protein [Hyphomicrobiales bacterium]